MVATTPIIESVSKLEAFLDNADRDKSISPRIMFAPEQAKMLTRSSEHDLVRHAQVVSIESLRGILDAIKTQILTWCLKLEQDGIVGADMTFSKEEQQKAAESHYTTNFHIGTMTQSQIQHAKSASSQVLQDNTLSSEAVSDVLGKLRAHIDEIGLDAQQRAQVDADSTAVEAQLKAPSPNHGVMREAFRSIRNVLEGTAGSLIASGLIYEIGRLGF